MYAVQCVATAVLVVFRSMPLLTELDSSEDGFGYKHGAPNGAVPPPPRQHSSPPNATEIQSQPR
jgi:hypothetical protein